MLYITKKYLFLSFSKIVYIKKFINLEINSIDCWMKRLRCQMKSSRTGYGLYISHGQTNKTTNKHYLNSS